jgi:hypothetical protein
MPSSAGFYVSLLGSIHFQHTYGSIADLLATVDSELEIIVTACRGLVHAEEVVCSIVICDEYASAAVVIAALQRLSL